MRAAPLAEHLCAPHKQAVVRVELDIGGVYRLVEARPARPGLELGAGAEQLGPAGGAAVGAVRLGVDVFTAERRLGPLLPQHVVLRRRQLAPPFVVLLCLCRRFGHALSLGAAASGAGWQAVEGERQHEDAAATLEPDAISPRSRGSGELAVDARVVVQR